MPSRPSSALLCCLAVLIQVLVTTTTTTTAFVTNTYSITKPTLKQRPVFLSSSLLSQRRSAAFLRMVQAPDKGSEEYEKIIENLMVAKDMTKEEAEADYDRFLSDSSKYSTEKDEDYYRSLGYKSVLDGMIGEAEKEGNTEVKETIEEFKKQSQMQALGIIAVTFGAFVYAKLTYFNDPSVFQ